MLNELNLKERIEMDISFFQDKMTEPSGDNLKEAVAGTYPLWKELHEFVIQQYPKGIEEWKYPGKKYGWSFRIKDKKRNIIYFLPRDKYFKIALVFGEKATEQVLASDIPDEIKTELRNATAYVEGRGIRIDVKDQSPVDDIKKMIRIKLDN